VKKIDQDSKLNASAIDIVIETTFCGAHDHNVAQRDAQPTQQAIFPILTFTKLIPRWGQN
jgi:hypothetical protein